MLQIKQFSKRYQDQLVLTIDELTISPGISWLKGENGAGKTTLFKSIAGIVPFEGELSLDDVSIKKEPISFRKLVNYSEAEPYFPEFLTAKDIVRFVGKTKNTSIEEQDGYCRMLGIDQYFTKPCGTFSSGMLKKLSLTIAFFGQPKLIILDEPLVTLDEASRIILMNMVNEKLKDPSMIFLMSSHQSMDSAEFSVENVFRIQNKSIVRL
ncbi:MAG: ABC transporter ATP-binding protein [Cyclobacteriaceae bacterium]|nr:ABC transporter ATP-binding protein [Cyclobacteriaceae bacterium]